MGLDEFKKEGPRTWSPDNDRYADSSSEAVHKLRGTEPETGMVPGLRDVHEVVVMEVESTSEPGELRKVYTCKECDLAGSTFEAIIKSQKLKFEDEDWYEQFYQSASEAAEGHSVEEVLDDRALDIRDEEEDETEEENVDPSNGSGLDSFL
jgi:hypothetical protein